MDSHASSNRPERRPGAAAIQGRVPGPEWNELQFVSWREFKQMVPSILQLEIARLGRMIETGSGGPVLRNSLVRARFALRQFVAGLNRAEKPKPDEVCVAHLRAAIMAVSFPPEGVDEQAKGTCRYILDRLNYVYRRIDLIYW